MCVCVLQTKKEAEQNKPQTPELPQVLPGGSDHPNSLRDLEMHSLTELEQYDVYVINVINSSFFVCVCVCASN